MSESSSKLNTTHTTENCLTKKAHKKYLESITSLMFMDSFRLVFVQMFNMKKGIIPEIAHNAISTLYSNMFEYWTFNKVNIFRLIKLENSGFTVKNKIKNEITLKIENDSITSSLKTILNNFDIEDLFINEPPIDEIIGRILIKKNYDI